MAVSHIKTVSNEQTKPFFSKLTSIVLPGLLLLLLGGSTAQAQLKNSKISGTYKVKYNGLHLGKLHFSSTIRGRSYKMESSTRLSVPLLSSLFNSLSWRAITRISGTIRNQKPRPSTYHFAFRSGKKSGTIDMQFAETT